MKLLIGVKKREIFKNVMPGRNQYFDFFEINIYVKVGKRIPYYILIKCVAFWVLFWGIKLLLGVKNRNL